MADLVLVSVPIRATAEVIREIAPLLSEDQVFMISPPQGRTRPAMLASRVEVIGLHPMFGRASRRCGGRRSFNPGALQPGDPRYPSLRIP